MFYVYRAYTSIGSRTLPVLLPIHIVAAALGLVSGAVALSAAKGGRLHRAQRDPVRLRDLRDVRHGSGERRGERSGGQRDGRDR